MRSQVLFFLVLITLPTGVAAADNWAIYRDTEHGCHISYPRNFFTRDDRVSSGVTRFTGPNEKTFFRVMESDNQEKLSLEALKRKYFSETVPGETIYERSTGDFLVFSGYRKERIFYARVELSSDKRTMCIFEITYPREQKRAFDKLVTQMSRSFSVQ